MKRLVLVFLSNLSLILFFQFCLHFAHHSILVLFFKPNFPATIISSLSSFAVFPLFSFGLSAFFHSFPPVFLCFLKSTLIFLFYLSFCFYLPKFFSFFTLPLLPPPRPSSPLPAPPRPSPLPFPPLVVLNIVYFSH